MPIKCQCPEQGEVPEHRLYMYDEITERPFANHDSDECKCTNDIRMYQRNGETLLLCSCCHQSGDVLVTQ